MTVTYQLNIAPHYHPHIYSVFQYIDITSKFVTIQSLVGILLPNMGQYKSSVSKVELDTWIIRKRPKMGVVHGPCKPMLVRLSNEHQMGVSCIVHCHLCSANASVAGLCSSLLSSSIYIIDAAEPLVSKPTSYNVCEWQSYSSYKMF